MVLEGLSFNFSDAIDYLVNIGVYDVILPFLLVFAIMFAILEKTQVLGKDKTNINAVVSIVVGLLVIVQKGIVETINLFLPRVSLIIIVILMGLVTISLVAGKEFTGLKDGVLGFAIILIIGAIIFALTTPPTGYGSWLTPADIQIILTLGIPIVLAVIVLMLVTRKPGGNEKKNRLKDFADAFVGNK